MRNLSHWLSPIIREAPSGAPLPAPDLDWGLGAGYSILRWWAGTISFGSVRQLLVHLGMLLCQEESNLMRFSDAEKGQK